MKIGVCIGTDIEKAKYAKELGYDYVESHCQNIAKMTYEELDDFKNCGIPVFSANCFIGLRVIGPNKNPDEINTYLDTMFEKANYLGIKICVFGSSGARNIRDDEPPMSTEQAYDEIASFLREFVVPRCEKYDICVAIEPLRKAESNVINTIEEGVKVAEKTGSDYIKVLCDVKHMVEENDSFDNINKYASWLIHAHTSNPFPDASTGKKRIYPREGDSFDQSLFFLPLVNQGVQQCAIEADVIDFKIDAAEAILALKKFR